MVKWKAEGYLVEEVLEITVLNFPNKAEKSGALLPFCGKPQTCWQALCWAAAKKHRLRTWAREHDWKREKLIFQAHNLPDRWELYCIFYLFEKGTSEFTEILLLLLSMDTTPPPRFPALPFTLMRSCRNCSCKYREHGKEHRWSHVRENAEQTLKFHFTNCEKVAQSVDILLGYTNLMTL